MVEQKVCLFGLSAKRQDCLFHLRNGMKEGTRPDLMSDRGKNYGMLGGVKWIWESRERSPW